MSTKEKAPKLDRGESMWAELGRRFKQNPFLFVGTIVVLIITIIAFILVPVLSDLGSTGSGSLNFGSYDGEPIYYSYGNYFADQRDYYNAQYRQAGDDSYNWFTVYQIWRSAFESTVIRTAALKETKKVGFSTPTSVVDKRLAEYPTFQENGRFSAAKYRALSDSERMELRENLADDYAMSVYLDELIGLEVSKAETEFVKSTAAKERGLEFVTFPLSSYPDSEVSAYISANLDKFRQIKLSKLTMTASQADAAKVLDQVKNGSLSFEDAVKTHSKDDLVEKNGDMGIKYAYEMETEIPDSAELSSVFALETGSLSPVVKVPSGWAFFRCDEAVRDSDPGDASVIEKARAYIYSFNRGAMEDYFLSRAEELKTRAESESLNSAAQAFGLEAKSAGPFPLNYGDLEMFKSISIENLPGASTNEAFLKAAFLTPLGQIATPVVIGDNVVIIKVVSEQDSEESTLSMVDFYYPYLASQYSQVQLQSYILESDKLKDNFYEVFSANFMPE